MEIRDFWCLTNLFLTETWTPSTRTLPPTILLSIHFSYLNDRLCNLSDLSSFVSAISPFSPLSSRTISSL
ncbi:hypothetical protein Scep_017137 [Stephania cephalantha]|uniref:Uncharacterized protein n=1 Tax=Stephania cephalantha TaxID=152367 RepID=A0AAP0IP08_9MAGN